MRFAFSIRNPRLSVSRISTALFIWGAASAFATALPIAFEPNRGQFDPAVRFLAHAGSTVFITDDGATVVLPPDNKGRQSAIRLAWLGSRRPSQAVEGEVPLPGKVNYLDPDHGKNYTNLPTYGRVRCQEVWPGIDVVYYGTGGQLEYDFIVAPGTDPNRIRFRVIGLDRLRLDERGDLSGETGAFTVVQRKPLVYQEVNGVRLPVPGRFVLHNGNAGFRVAAYRKELPLVVDPTLVYTARFGGPGITLTTGSRPIITSTWYADIATKVAVDDSGAAYVTGMCSSGFPISQTPVVSTTSNGYTFLAKLNPEGTALVFTTYVSAQAFSYFDFASVAVDKSGNSYVITGGNWTHSYVRKINATGDRILYQASIVDRDYSPLGPAIAVDSAGNAYVSGSTSSDSYVVKLNPAGTSRVYTFSFGWAQPTGIAVDDSGNAYVTGQTTSSSFPTTAGAYQEKLAGSYGAADLFVTKLGPNGNTIFSTLLGGTLIEYGGSIAVDPAGNIFVTGTTASIDFPVVSTLPEFPFYPYAGGAIVAKLSADGARLLYSSKLQVTDGSTYGRGIGLDPQGRVLVAGYVNSFLEKTPAAFPIKGGFQAGALPGKIDYVANPYATLADGRNIFVVSIDTVKSELVYSTLLGDSVRTYPWGLAVDRAGNAYVAGRGCCFPHVDGSLSDASGARSILVAKIAPDGEPPQFTPQSITNAANFQAGLGPGMIGTIFGTGLSGAVGVVAANTAPLPTELAGTSVRVNGTPAPLLSVSNVDGAEQINFVVPWPDSPPYSGVEVTYKGVSGYASIVTATAPAIFTTEGSQAAIQHGGDYALVTQANPARKGEALVMYVTGIGPVDPAVPGGTAAPSSPLSRTVYTASVTVGGVAAQVLFSGLTPGATGLGQVNFRVPDGAPSGSVDTVLRYDKLTQPSAAVKLWVE